MDAVSPVASLIDKWPTVTAWAEDIGLKRASHGTLMKMRGRIPVAYWPAMILHAKRRKIPGVTNDTLAAAHAQAPSRKTPRAPRGPRPEPLREAV